jgi:inosine-uridine nucleoside N-ribohydrolase
MNGSCRQSLATDPVSVIFDTDISGDVDDVLALAMLHTLADRRECEIHAVTISKINPLTAPFVDAVNTFYGRANIPIGVTRNAQIRDSKYLHLCKQSIDGNRVYSHDLESSDDAPDALTVLRRTLSAAPDQSIVIIQVGLASNLADLVESPADTISEMTGRELIEKKVKLVSVMAGAFEPVNGDPHYLEANVKNGIQSMQRFSEKWPIDCPVIWSDFNIGTRVTYPRQSIARDFEYQANHIVKEAYLLHSGPNHDRPSWDLTSVLYAVRPDDHYFTLSPQGQVSTAEDGYTSFTETENGRDRYLIMSDRQANRVRESLRHLVSQPPR